MRYPLTFLFSWLSLFLLAGMPDADSATPRIAYIENEERLTGEAGLGRYFAAQGIKADNLFPILESGKPVSSSYNVLVLGSFTAVNRSVKDFLQNDREKLHAFVRRGGCIIVLAQDPRSWNRSRLLLPGLVLLGSNRTYSTVPFVDRRHPLFSRPNAISHRRLNKEWRGEGLCPYAFRAVSRGHIIAAQDELGRDPFCAEFGWGKGRVVFLACAPDQVTAGEPASRQRLARDLMENALAYAAAVVEGEAPPLPDHAVVVESKNGIEPRAAYYTRAARLPFEREINASVDLGVSDLKARQLSNGSWGSYGNYAVGPTALVMVALLGAGISKHDPCIQKGMKFLLDQPPVYNTYELGLILMFMDAFAAPMYERFQLEKLPPEKRRSFKLQRDLTPVERRFMEQCCDNLISGQSENGYWSYSRSTYGGDLSNTQFAVLGLRSAARCGLEVPWEIWLPLIQALLEAQADSGPRVTLPEFQHFYQGTGKPKFYVFDSNARPWGYRPAQNAGDATGSRTAMGISSLLFAYEGLAMASERKADVYTDRIRKAVRDGLAWIWSNWSVEENPLAGDAHFHYYLYALERVGVGKGLKFIGDKDWYDEGAAVLLGEQRESGSWGRLTDTCFALMFLKRTTPPPVITLGK